MSLLEAIEPVPRKPIAERVANRLLDLVRSGNLKAGDKLPTENELAAAMQVSRPIVREALRGLSILGVVESRQGGRCYVTDLAPSRLLAPLEFVIALDESIRIAAGSKPPGPLPIARVDWWPKKSTPGLLRYSPRVSACLLIRCRRVPTTGCPR